MKCRECGVKIPDNSRYCPDCGALIEENYNRQKQNQAVNTFSYQYTNAPQSSSGSQYVPNPDFRQQQNRGEKTKKNAPVMHRVAKDSL